MNNGDRGSCWHDKGFVSAGEKFTFRKGKDLPVADSLVDEPRGSGGLDGLIHDGVPIEDMSRTSSRVTVVTESVWTSMLINRDRRSCWHNKGFVSVEKFNVSQREDLPVADRTRWWMSPREWRS